MIGQQIYAYGAVFAFLICVVMYLLLRKRRKDATARAAEGAVLRTVVDNLPDLIYVKDLDGRFLLANNAVARMMGAMRPSDLLGKNDFDFHLKELATRYHNDEQALIRSGEPLLAHEEECRDPGGGLVFLETTKIPLRDAAGNVTGLVGIGRNITSRVTESRALVQAVQESREVIQSMLAGARDSRIATQGKNGNLKFLAEGINELIDNVSTTVAETVQMVKSAVDGDLTARMQVDNKTGEFKALASSVNSLIRAMMEVVTSLTSTCRAVQVGAGEISRGNLDLSKRTDEQASSLMETTASMKRMTSTVKNNANNAAQAKQLAFDARQEAERGGAVVSAAVTAMTEIHTASNKIAEITSVIDEIAFQTNLLALNAAVEAARAGDQGKGFAVVASEVRNLASRSAQAAKEIKLLIQDSGSKVIEGAKLVNQSGEMLGEIVKRVTRVTDVMAQIADSSREQASGIEQVNGAVSAMDAMTRQNAELVERAAEAAQALDERATALMKLIEHYRVQ